MKMRRFSSAILTKYWLSKLLPGVDILPLLLRPLLGAPCLGHDLLLLQHHHHYSQVGKQGKTFLFVLCISELTKKAMCYSSYDVFRRSKLPQLHCLPLVLVGQIQFTVHCPTDPKSTLEKTVPYRFELFVNHSLYLSPLLAATKNRKEEISDPRVRHRTLVGRAKMRTIKVGFFLSLLKIK